jgi:hypothetical protein
MFYTYVIEISLVFLGIPIMLFFVQEAPNHHEQKERLSFEKLKQTLKRFVFTRNFIIICILNSLSQVRLPKFYSPEMNTQ